MQAGSNDNDKGFKKKSAVWFEEERLIFFVILLEVKIGNTYEVFYKDFVGVLIAPLFKYMD